jgi:hypothetical protein
MLGKYRFFQKKAFEPLQKFETRLNEECAKGWCAVSISNDHGSLTVLLERESKH